MDRFHKLILRQDSFFMGSMNIHYNPFMQNPTFYLSTLNTKSEIEEISNGPILSLPSKEGRDQ